jgi:predicted GNAT superfamily acetyltransferase
LTEPIIYRELHTIDDLNRVFDLEQAVWDMTPGDAVPAALLISVVENGGVVMGAEGDGELIGFAFGVPARKGGEWYLWSYMAGVMPGVQAKGIGLGLKAAQRQWALAHDYAVMKWTFDPMQRANANFNFRKLGVTANHYHINHYGTMTDGLNAGMQSDRLEVTWRLTDPAVEALLTGQAAAPSFEEPPPDAALVLYTDGQLHSMPFDASFPRLYVEIPPDLAALKRTNLKLAQQWQLALRDAFTAAFAERYFAQRIATSPDGRQWYVLGR